MKLLMTIFKYLCKYFWIAFLVGADLYGWYRCVFRKTYKNGEPIDDKDYKDGRNAWLFLHMCFMFIASLSFFAYCCKYNL